MNGGKRIILTNDGSLSWKDNSYLNVINVLMSHSYYNEVMVQSLWMSYTYDYVYYYFVGLDLAPNGVWGGV